MQKENLKFNSRMSKKCNDSIKQMTELKIRSSNFDIFIRKMNFLNVRQKLNF